jgi:hypothetical protein
MIAAVGKTHHSLVHVMLLLPLLLLVFVVVDADVVDAVFDASTLFKKGSVKELFKKEGNGKNQKIHSIVDLTCNKESTDTDTDTDTDTIDVDSSNGVLAGTIIKPASSGGGGGGAAATAPGSGAISDVAKIAVSITFNGAKENPDQFFDYIKKNINGFILEQRNEYLFIGWMNLCDDTLEQLEALEEVMHIKPTSQGHPV